MPFCCDLLSIAMGQAPSGSAWVTVMSNLNTLAVASLADVACVILAENAQTDNSASADNAGVSMAGVVIACVVVILLVAVIVVVLNSKKKNQKK